MSTKLNTTDSGPFDAYHIWLGIPRKNQPPNHYCLLGIELFEASPEAIVNAADQRMAHLRGFQNGPHSALSQTLLNRVAAAKVCLLDPVKKAGYDQAMRERLGVELGEQALCAGVVRSETPWSAREGGFAIDRLLGSETLGPSSQPRQSAKIRKRRSIKIAIGWVLAALAAIGLVSWRSLLRSFGDSAKPPATVAANGVDSIEVSTPQTRAKSSEVPAERSQYVEMARPSQGVLPAASPNGQSPTAASPSAVSKPNSAPPVNSGAATVQADRGEMVATTPNDFDKLVASRENPPPDSIGKVTKPALTPGPSPEDGRGETNPGTGKRPPPSAEIQREVAAKLSEELGLAAAKTADAKLRRAEVLFRMNERFTDRPNERFVLLRTIADFAGQGGDAALVVAAIDATAGQFALDALATKEKLLKKFAAAPATGPRIRSFVRGSRPVIEQAVAAGDFEAALGLANLAYQLCQTAQGKEYRKEAIERRAEVQAAAARHEQIEAAKKALKNDPDNGPANLLLGRWYCTEQRDWPHGIECLAKAADGGLRQVAQKDGASPADVEEQAKLGDAWWDLAQSRSAQDRAVCLSRAGFWYQKAAPRMPAGLLRVRTEKRLGEIRAEHLAF
jgi:tetratricopeptide (TPR) repeat protein